LRLAVVLPVLESFVSFAFASLRPRLRQHVVNGDLESASIVAAVFAFEDVVVPADADNSIDVPGELKTPRCRPLPNCRSRLRKSFPIATISNSSCK
jgi:hypothetical protein